MLRACDLFFPTRPRSSPPPLPQDTIDRQSLKVDALRAAGASPSSAAARASSSAAPASSARAKKADRLEAALKTTLLREMGAARVKQAAVSTLALVLTMQAASRLFGGRAVVRLPFEPFPLMRGVAHRGLEGHALTDGSWVILFTLVQAGVRPVLAKLIDAGPSRRMTDLCQQWGPGAMAEGK